MARVRWIRGGGGGGDLAISGMLAGLTGGLRAVRENESRQFAYDQQQQGIARSDAERRQRLQDEMAMVQFREAVKRDGERQGALYSRMLRADEIRQLKAAAGGGWTPDHDVAAEVYRLTGDHGALRQVFTPVDPDKQAAAQLRNTGLELANQTAQEKLLALRGKETRDAAVRSDLRQGVNDAAMADIVGGTDAYFNATGDAGPSRGQYDEDIRTAAANLQAGRAQAALGKPYTFERPRIVRPEHGTDPDTKRRLEEAEQRREEQAAVTELRAYAKQLAAEADQATDPAEERAKRAELADIRAELGRRARQNLQGGRAAPPKGGKPAVGGDGDPDKKAGADFLRALGWAKGGSF